MPPVGLYSWAEEVIRVNGKDRYFLHFHILKFAQTKPESFETGITVCVKGFVLGCFLCLFHQTEHKIHLFSDKNIEISANCAYVNTELLILLQ